MNPFSKEYIKDRTKAYFRPLAWVIALIFLIEEAIWDWGAARMARLGMLRAVRFVEHYIAKLPPYPALLAFLLPDLFIVPAKLIGMHAIDQGHLIIGVVVFIIAKVAGMALVARIFNLTKPALMQLPWFVKLYNFVMKYRNKIHAYLDNWEAYQATKAKFKAMKESIKRKFS